MKSAEETKQGVDEELRVLERTLTNIEEARSWEDLTVVSFIKPAQIWREIVMLTLCALQDEIVAAAPEIDVQTEKLVSKGIWMPPGYKVCLLPPPPLSQGYSQSKQWHELTSVGKIWRSIRGLNGDGTGAYIDRVALEIPVSLFFHPLR